MGSAGRDHPDFFRFVPISPFSSDLFRFALLVFGKAPISSDLFRFVPFSSDLFSEQIRANHGNHFLPTPGANPRQNGVGWVGAKNFMLKNVVRFLCSLYQKGA